MTRCTTTGGKGSKVRRRNTKSRDASRRRPSPADLQKLFNAQARELAETRSQLSEALEQQTATSEVLRVISNSSTEIQSVLDAIATAAARLLDVSDADIMRVEGELLRCVA